MAFNLAALKGLFGRLRPAAKAVANYGDDVANAVVNYSDDAAKALTTYGDDVAQMAFANADDLAAATAQSDDIAKRVRNSDAPLIWNSDAVGADGFDWDIVKVPNDYGPPDYETPIYGARNKIQGNTDELIAYLNNVDEERAAIDALEAFDPDAYKSGMSWEPPRNSVIAPELFGGGGGYDNRLVGSFSYPDGFINPESAAMYYDSLERGYIPVEYLDAGNEIRQNWARDDISRRLYGLPGLYDDLKTELGPDAFSNANKSDAYKQIQRKLKHLLTRRP